MWFTPGHLVSIFVYKILFNSLIKESVCEYDLWDKVRFISSSANIVQNQCIKVGFHYGHPGIFVVLMLFQENQQVWACYMLCCSQRQNKTAERSRTVSTEIFNIVWFGLSKYDKYLLYVAKFRVIISLMWLRHLWK